ncbi:hypothetical protein WNZ15_26170 [Roseibium sp. AS2]|uniref:hypothetical protein n=1 Tax=Roseibium sp. AS2 TaxID=3135781 RepID=UPI00317E82BA
MSVSAGGARGDVKPINPVWSVDEDYIRNFLISMIRVYSFYGEVKEKPNSSDFIFVSGDHYLKEGKMNLQKVAKFFPDLRPEVALKFQGESDFCLIIKLQNENLVRIVGINDSSAGDRPQNLSCVLQVFAYKLTENKDFLLSGNSVEGKARNFIDLLREKY